MSTQKMQCEFAQQFKKGPTIRESNTSVAQKTSLRNRCSLWILTVRVSSTWPFANTQNLVVQHVFHDAHEPGSRVAFIYDRSDAKLWALPLQHVCKEYRAQHNRQAGH